MKTKLLLLFAFFTLHLAAQERKPLRGAVTIGDARVPGVFVINKNTGAEVKTDGSGSFTIQAKNGDKIAVNSPITVDREFYISDDSFKKMPYLLAVEAKPTQLEEVVVNDTIKIIQPVKSVAAYTPGERRVNAGATTKLQTMDANWQGGGGIAIPLDAVLNGKKATALKRDLKTEKLQKNVEAIEFNFSTEYITETLGIPAEKLDAFIYFAAEDEDLAKAIKENNAEQSRLQIAALSKDYLEKQLEETETAPPAQKQED